MKAKKEERREDKRENRRARRLAARASRYSCKAAIHLLLMWCPSVLSNLSCSPQRILMARATLGRYLPRHLVTLSGGGHASRAPRPLVRPPGPAAAAAPLARSFPTGLCASSISRSGLFPFLSSLSFLIPDVNDIITLLSHHNMRIFFTMEDHS